MNQEQRQRRLNRQRLTLHSRVCSTGHDARAQMNSKRKLLVTGAHGFVAGSVLAHTGEEWDVHALSRSKLPAEKASVHWHICETLDQPELNKVFSQVQPDAVIHTAALADIDFCQTHPEMARAVNVELTLNIADLCAGTGCRLVFCSTDTIFDGERAPYKEEDPPGPLNLYAETKVEAEEIVSRLGKQAVIARLALVVGLPFLGAGNSFMFKMIAALKQGREVGMSDHEIRSPVDVITLGRALIELAGDHHHGIFHLAGLDRMSRLEMGRAIAKRFGFAETLVFAQPRAAVPGRATRPRDVSLDSRKVCARLKTPMLKFDEALSLILQHRHD